MKNRNFYKDPYSKTLKAERSCSRGRKGGGGGGIGSKWERERKKGDEEGGKQEKLYLIHSTQEEF